MNNDFLKKILYVLASFVTYFLFYDVLKFKVYNGVSILIFCLLFLFYSSYDIIGNYVNKSEIHNYGIIFCLFLSFSQVLGYVVYLNQYNSSVSVFREFFSIRYILDFIGLFFFLYNVYIRYSSKIVKFTFNQENQCLSRKKIYFLSLLFILMCWLPYFLVLYPGVLTPDSVSQFSSVVDGFHIVSDHHPVVHTLFIGVLYNIGNFIFNNPISATGFVSFVQMFIMANIFSYFVYFLNSKRISFKILAIVICYFALSPLHAYYSITMWKDILFGGFILLFVIQLIKMDSEKINFISVVKFIMLSLLVLFFRNNAIYMYIFLMPFTCYHYRKFLVKIVSSMLFCIFVFYIVKGPIFGLLNISKSSSSEYLAIPMQQIGRMAYKSVEFSEYEKEMIDNIIDVSILSDVYNPINCDNIKFSPYYNISSFDQNKFQYFNLWVNLVLKHPSIAVESYLNSTLGYWYVGVEYWATSSVVSDNNFGVYRASKLNGLLSNYVNGITSRNIPILSLQWSIGLCFILIFMASFILVLKKQFFKLYYFVPILGIWITMMLASPVYAEFRYVYGAFTCLPLFLILPFMKKEKIDS